MKISVSNNTAAQCIMRNEFDRAISILAKSLREIKQMMSDDIFAQEHISSSSAPSSKGSEQFLCGFASSSERDSSFENISSSLIFRDPVFLSQHMPPEEFEKCNLTSYVVLYNLALAYHLRGMKENDHNRALSHLEKATIFYEHAHQLLSQLEVPVSMIHSMAIASNLGQIHLFMRNSTKAEMCFHHLLSTILYVVDCGTCGQSEKSLDGFVRNVMPLLRRSSTAAAA